jgi:hypothetical protein
MGAIPPKPRIAKSLACLVHWTRLPEKCPKDERNVKRGAHGVQWGADWQGRIGRKAPRKRSGRFGQVGRC